MGGNESSFERFSFDKFETCFEDVFENESVKQFTHCTKSEYHTHYIDAPEFKMQDLPKKFQKDNIYRLVQLLADLTVKIKVSYVSDGRNQPASFQYQKGSFPLSHRAGQNRTFTGSGRIWDIFPIEEKHKLANVTCPCPECVGKENTKLWIAKVYTATHVVFDTKEAKHAECILHYDSSSLSEDTKLYGVKAKWNHKEGDLCILYCVICDQKLVETIQKKNLELSQRWQELKTAKGYNEKEKLAVIVSHPHGCPKQISVGEWESRVEVNNGKGNKEHRFTYDRSISTCSGSSGGPIYILGSSYPYSAYCHSGTSEKENFSSCWRDKDKTSSNYR